ncbi:hypothetical protein CEG14_05605 [Bordetella genomosp. 1]|uniref:Uncharacterized protein n=1 Tax=Bordetella genomosp. 1 TaxID=1395607 RepID=A0A261SPL3_9BORD|nr:hypothetical protein [Bordetella genomosp. 1]OZI39011.1 hypothetical protein CEG14_05605 [Bordetella genomosp. 1]
MTETQKLLEQAQDIARRGFENPSEATVMELFNRLCDEIDRARDEACGDEVRGLVH